MIRIDATYRYPAGRKLKLKFEASEGEKVFLAGKTGCGKSTLLRLLNGLIPEFYGGKLEGIVSVFGRRGNPDDVYLVTQHPEEQIVCSNVVEEVSFSLVQRGIDWEEAEMIAEDTLEKVGILDLANRDPSTLSDGEKQLVLVASAMANDARCLAFDEPFAHLHPEVAGRVLDIILSDNRTVVMAEHRLELSKGFDVVHFMSSINEPDCKNLGTYTPGEVIVKAKDASIFRGKRKVLDGLSFEVHEREALAVTGPNGAGKTSLLRAIAGLEKSEGIKVRGKAFMSYQYPSYTLNSSTVGEEVSLSLLKKFGLESYAGRHPHSLSSGERRILAAIKALRGKVVLLDEPTAGLDRGLRTSFILRLIKEIREMNKCLIIATHDRAVTELCDTELELKEAEETEYGW